MGPYWSYESHWSSRLKITDPNNTYGFDGNSEVAGAGA